MTDLFLCDGLIVTISVTIRSVQTKIIQFVFFYFLQIDED